MLSKQIEYFSFLVTEQRQANQKAPILVIFSFQELYALKCPMICGLE